MGEDDTFRCPCGPARDHDESVSRFDRLASLDGARYPRGVDQARGSQCLNDPAHRLPRQANVERNNGVSGVPATPERFGKGGAAR